MACDWRRHYCLCNVNDLSCSTDRRVNCRSVEGKVMRDIVLVVGSYQNIPLWRKLAYRRTPTKLRRTKWAGCVVSKTSWPYLSGEILDFNIRYRMRNRHPMFQVSHLPFVGNRVVKTVCITFLTFVTASSSSVMTSSLRHH